MNLPFLSKRINNNRSRSRPSASRSPSRSPARDASPDRRQVKADPDHPRSESRDPQRRTSRSLSRENAGIRPPIAARIKVESGDEQEEEGEDLRGMLNRRREERKEDYGRVEPRRRSRSRTRSASRENRQRRSERFGRAERSRSRSRSRDRGDRRRRSRSRDDRRSRSPVREVRGRGTKRFEQLAGGRFAREHDRELEGRKGDAQPQQPGASFFLFLLSCISLLLYISTYE